ncbi:MAG: hypothetical protein ABEJ03_01610 [Candidatus Nanohaloarchaea archaeon]
MTEEYIEYVGVFSTSMAATAASYLISLQRPFTALLLLLIPFSLGFTAFISRKGFKRSSISSLPCLFLVGTHPATTVVAVVVAVSNPLISVFSSGSEFKDFFNTVTVPVLIAGLVAGGVIYGQALQDPGKQEAVENAASDLVSAQASILVQNTGYSTGSATQNVSKTAIKAAESTVVRSMADNLTKEQLKRLRSSFDAAERRLSDSLKDRTGTSGADRIERISGTVTDRLVTEKTMIGLIPAMGMLMYTLSPFIGLLTGAFGVVFRRLLADT